MAKKPILVWFRRDLRLADNPALAAAAATGVPVVPVYVHEPEEGAWRRGDAAGWWLGRSLAALSESLTAMDSFLVVRQGTAAEALTALVRETGAEAVYWNRRYEPHLRAADEAAAAALRAVGANMREEKDFLLFEPWEIASRPGTPYQLFSAFWKACLTRGEPPPALPPPARLERPQARPADSAPLLAQPPQATGWAESWQVGEAAAMGRLHAFLDQALGRYGIARDLPDQPGTSRLSPHLAFGEISPRQIWHAARLASDHGGDAFLREIGWREFCYHMLHHAPQLPDQPLRRQFADFPWISDDALFATWRDGRTGYPIVDAGMRALRATGWMHNRVRMIAASFLVKDLLQPWQAGEAWFWESLVDADLACNAANWQWVAGCGLDSAPYFRIFNPVLQGEKFDARGRFVRQWVPELAGLSDLFIHDPSRAPPGALAAAGIRLGETYPLPIVDHGAARRRALAAYEQTRGAA